MSEMKKEDFLALVEKLTEGQYADEPEPEVSWSGSIHLDELEDLASLYRPKPSFRSKPKLRALDKKFMGQAAEVDLTKATMVEIKEQIEDLRRVVIGRFNIQLKHSDKGIDMQVYEIKKKTFGGIVKEMPEKVNFLKDSRFEGKDWIRFFKNNMGGVSIPVDTAAEILKWIQVVFKYPAFL